MLKTLFHFLKDRIVLNDNLSATVIANYDGYKKELHAWGIDFGKFALLFATEHKGTRQWTKITEGSPKKTEGSIVEDNNG